MKIAGLLPIRFDPRKSKFRSCLQDLERTCDEIIIMHDNPMTGMAAPASNKITETLMVMSHYGHQWNDFCNRATLLARAAKYGCECAMQLDDDEMLGKSLDWIRVRYLAETMINGGFSQVVVNVKTMWNDTHHRTDGIFGQLRKTFLLQNPFMIKGPFEWQYGPEFHLHHFPTVALPTLSTGDDVVHWGMRTPELRAENVAKYQKQDPENKLCGIKYDYLLDETGMTLEPL